MPTRIIRDGILDSEAVNSLSDSGEIFYRRLMSIIDDFGRYECKLPTIRAKLFGGKLEAWPLERVQAALNETTQTLNGDGEPLVTVYTVANHKYLQLNNFGQRERVSKCPPPPNAAERCNLRQDAAERSEARQNAAYAKSDAKSKSKSGANAKASRAGSAPDASEASVGPEDPPPSPPPLLEPSQQNLSASPRKPGSFPLVATEVRRHFPAADDFAIERIVELSRQRVPGCSERLIANAVNITHRRGQRGLALWFDTVPEWLASRTAWPEGDTSQPKRAEPGGACLHCGGEGQVFAAGVETAADLIKLAEAGREAEAWRPCPECKGQQEAVA